MKACDTYLVQSLPNLAKEMCNILQQLANATSLSIYPLTPTSYISRSGEKCPLVHEYLELSF